MKERKLVLISLRICLVLKIRVCEIFLTYITLRRMNNEIVFLLTAEGSCANINKM